MTIKPVWIGLALVAVAVFSVGGYYNSFIAKQTAITAQMAQVDNQEQRRYDVITELISVVKKNAKFEQETFIGIANARTQWAGSRSNGDKIAAAQQMDSALGRLMVAVEQYPQLRANEQFARLMDEMAGTENRLAVERMRYNQAVQEYDVAVKSFPGNLVAGAFGFKPSGEYFKVSAEAKQHKTLNMD